MQTQIQDLEPLADVPATLEEALFFLEAWLSPAAAVALAPYAFALAEGRLVDYPDDGETMAHLLFLEMQPPPAQQTIASYLFDFLALRVYGVCAAADNPAQ